MTHSNTETPDVSVLVEECMETHETAEKTKDALDELQTLIKEATDSNENDLVHRVTKINEFLQTSVVDITSSKEKLTTVLKECNDFSTMKQSLTNEIEGLREVLCTLNKDLVNHNAKFLK